jgi:hypothetical protein
MDLWDRDAIDLVGPAIIEITADGRGSLRFIAVQGFIDARHVDLDGRPGVEFSWDGNDEGDHVSGRGWARLDDDGSLRGHLFIHSGDDSGFRADAADMSEAPMSS